jgi:hypothetical protein
MQQQLTQVGREVRVLQVTLYLQVVMVARSRPPEALVAALEQDKVLTALLERIALVLLLVQERQHLLEAVQVAEEAGEQVHLLQVVLEATLAGVAGVAVGLQQQLERLAAQEVLV